MTNAILFEVCCGSTADALAAYHGGANRVELNSDMFHGGLTPTLGSLRTVKKHAPDLKVMCMVRPREGGFHYGRMEFETMLEDGRIFKENGADGIVFGILNGDGTIDRARSEKIIEAARPLPVTFHRAFDMTKDLFSSLETLIDMGVDRVLTSGGEPTVMEGILNLKALVEKAGDRIIVMPGCGINEKNFSYLKETVKAKEYHVYLPVEEESRMEWRPGHIYMGGMLRQPEFFIQHTSSDRVRTIVGDKR